MKSWLSEGTPLMGAENPAEQTVLQQQTSNDSGAEISCFFWTCFELQTKIRGLHTCMYIPSTRVLC